MKLSDEFNSDEIILLLLDHFDYMFFNIKTFIFSMFVKNC